MSVTTKIVSSSDALFHSQYASQISLGARPIGDPWSDGTNTYIQVAVYDNSELSYNKDLLSRVWRAKNSVTSSLGGFPSSSLLSFQEQQMLYSGSL